MCHFRSKTDSFFAEKNEIELLCSQQVQTKGAFLTTCGVNPTHGQLRLQTRGRSPQSGINVQLPRRLRHCKGSPKSWPALFR